jgi:hypothetical protein
MIRDLTRTGRILERGQEPEERFALIDGESAEPLARARGLAGMQLDRVREG